MQPVTCEALAALAEEDPRTRIRQLPAAAPPPREDVTPVGPDEPPAVGQPGVGPAEKIDFMRRLAADGIRQITMGMNDEEILRTWGLVPQAPQATGARRAATGAAEAIGVAVAAEQPQAPAWQPRGTGGRWTGWTAEEWKAWRESQAEWQNWLAEQDRRRGGVAPAADEGEETQSENRAPAANEPEETQSEAEPSPRAAPQINWGSRTLNKSRNIQERGIPYTRMRKFS